ncbi:MAG: hypothetical protein HOM34_09495 [Planctomycetes bacterium]|jgi:hypothetical protein|nr:hypothetical protein [Planctomycetota bacterium]MBT4029019.1 hypothetical protein [Planctomycetota bacterium]MBT4560361.1 hypothetical protein [Planctomycetota bacterium]MBT5120941.1 hypothetical protein [Planctomycetota bacterium]MBT7011490.1 hypothetical protein [Planctomycetota bacterium]
MSSADLEIRCPCCAERIRIDRLSGEIVAHSKDEKPIDFSAEAEKMEAKLKGSQSAADDFFAAALDKEKQRGDALEDAFSRAAEIADDNADGDSPDNALDDKWR